MPKLFDFSTAVGALGTVMVLFAATPPAIFIVCAILRLILLWLEPRWPALVRKLHDWKIHFLLLMHTKTVCPDCTRYREYLERQARQAEAGNANANANANANNVGRNETTRTGRTRTALVAALEAQGQGVAAIDFAHNPRDGGAGESIPLRDMTPQRPRPAHLTLQDDEITPA